MNVSPNALRKEVVEVLREISRVEIDLRATAVGMGHPSATLRDERGNWILPPLLLAKAQCLYTLTLLNEKK